MLVAMISDFLRVAILNFWINSTIPLNTPSYESHTCAVLRAVASDPGGCALIRITKVEYCGPFENALI